MLGAITIGDVLARAAAISRLLRVAEAGGADDRRDAELAAQPPGGPACLRGAVKSISTSALGEAGAQVG